MSKDKYYNRLEELFSNIEPLKPDPANGNGPSPAVSLVNETTSSNTSVDDPAQPLRADRSSRSAVLKIGGPEERTRREPAAMRTHSGSAWGSFFDAIHHQERFGFLADPSGIQPIDEGCDQTQEPAARLEAPIEVDGETIGQLRVDRNPDRLWSEDDVALVNTVVQQLAQQMETLRLLDEAERSRQGAEEAFQRLAHQGGRNRVEEAEILGRLKKYQNEVTQNDSLGFVFDCQSIQPLRSGFQVNSPENLLNVSLSLPGSSAGNIILEGEREWSAEEEDLAETIANRLARQVENLRLLEESNHYRGEAEQAVRRMTSESWRAYFENASTQVMCFQYDQNKVNPNIDANLFDEANAMAHPLTVREEVIGKVAIVDPVVDPREASGLVDVIAGRLSSHLEGLRLAEQREQALVETELLYGISARLSTAQSLEEALSSVSEPARETGARDSRLFFVTLDERGMPEGLTLAAIWYPEEGAQLIPVNAHFLLGDHPTYWQILKDPNSPLLIEDVLTDPTLTDEARELLTKTGARAAAVLPLVITGRWVGAIFINWEQPHPFSDQESRLYASLSRQAAVVVNNRLLLEQTRKRAQELQTVAQVSTAASTILDPKELLQAVVDLTKSSFSLYHAQAYLRDEFGLDLVITAGSGETGRTLSQNRVAIKFDSNAAVARAARDRQVVILNDTLNDPDFTAHPLLPEVHSEMAIPMTVGDRLLGVFNVQASTANRFSREDARIYTTLASQVAVALQNAELYAEQAATVERLRELDHLKSAFLANMSHELRTPLNSILGFAEVLLLGLDGPLNDTMNNDVRLIEKNGKHLLSLINDVLDMAKIEAGKMNLAFEKFILRELLEETLDITGSLAREKALHLVINPDSQDHFELVADRVRIRQVMINVVANAVKFTEKGGITINAVQLPELQKIRITVKDTGMGIPVDKLDLIFDSFSQVDTTTTRKAGGTGLGLPISRRLVEMHGGNLWAESTGVPGEGSTFIVELPFEAVKKL
jgi:signal transduction histidine kinase